MFTYNHVYTHVCVHACVMSYMYALVYVCKCIIHVHVCVSVWEVNLCVHVCVQYRCPECVICGLYYSVLRWVCMDMYVHVFVCTGSFCCSIS